MASADATRQSPIASLAGRCSSVGERLLRRAARPVDLERVRRPLRREGRATSDDGSLRRGTAGSTKAGAAPYEFPDSGRLQLASLEEIAGLTPSSHMLDVGCGSGRVAIAAAGYLDARGGYEGLEIVRDQVRWCKANVGNPHGNVRFTHAGIENRTYNPRGKRDACEYRFPFDDATFDLAIAISVFPRMLPAEVAHYLAEIARVLKPRGRLVATHHLINATSSRLIARRDPGLFTAVDDGSERAGEAEAVSFAGAEAHICELLRRQGFLAPEIVYGGWCGRLVSWDDRPLPATRRLNRRAAHGGQDTLVAIRA